MRAPNRPVQNSESTEHAESAVGVLVDDTFELNAVVQRFETPLLRYVTQLLGPGWAEIEDVVQDTFLRLHRQISKRGAASVKHLPSWLFRVAHNLAMDAGRKRKRRAQMQEKVMSDPVVNPVEVLQPPVPVEELGRREACDLAMAELANLPEEQKHVVLLKIIQGFTLREISEVTGLKIGTVNYRLTQGLRELSQRLKQAGAV